MYHRTHKNIFKRITGSTRSRMEQGGISSANTVPVRDAKSKFSKENGLPFSGLIVPLSSGLQILLWLHIAQCPQSLLWNPQVTTSITLCSTLSLFPSSLSAKTDRHRTPGQMKVTLELLEAASSLPFFQMQGSVQCISLYLLWTVKLNVDICQAKTPTFYIFGHQHGRVSSGVSLSYCDFRWQLLCRTNPYGQHISLKQWQRKANDTKSSGRTL